MLRLLLRERLPLFAVFVPMLRINIKRQPVAVDGIVVKARLLIIGSLRDEVEIEREADIQEPALPPRDRFACRQQLRALKRYLYPLDVLRLRVNLCFAVP